MGGEQAGVENVPHCLGVVIVCLERPGQVSMRENTGSGVERQAEVE